MARRPRTLWAGLALAFAASACQQPASAEAVVAAPEAAVKAAEAPGARTAIFAGGCFWGMEAVFSHVKGVSSVVSGYTGGNRAQADYETVSGGATGHAESIRVTYDPSVVRYDQLLQVFFGVASDPTELNRQGPDTGTQYRNALVPLDNEQRRVAAGYVAQLKVLNPWKRPIVTRIEPYKGFFAAEAYHQDFALKNPDHGYIKRWDAPKVAALQRTFPQFWKAAFTRN
ncbi:peptide-methionine (S)-S-oxide reductase MsrA [Novosphingobium sp. KCTC 2891]|uniref:peptide-methionine (S)-S-oxide reductase MsrA n=1 Tax=Novosphingobium sp. KCTC 2891 TaxID=2989730 RepID=UPI002221FAB9|nr:peptide-methionine (S)-S-oxide reductase MsrA [Novosphingobium sp. KCTC 2891]MCW1382197.1 peptide-methionine (S)-S-oxide reductase MsrA [Novosphingobium sp. KCTC 2891]